MNERVGREADGLTRKQLLGLGGRPPPRRCCSPRAPASSGRSPPRRKGRGNVAGMNVVLFLTDQERAIQHFPPNWLRQNLPGMRRLQRNGLSFERAFTNACMCSPARSTLMSGYFPAQHGVKYTLEEDMPAPKYPQVELPDRPGEPRDGDDGRRLQRRLQGQVALLEAGESKERGALRPRALRLHALEPARRGANQRRRPRRAAASSTTTAASWNRSATRRPATRACSSTSARRRQTAAVLPGHLAGQPARRPLLPEQDLRRSGLRRLLAAGRHRRAGDQRRRPLDQADGPGSSSCASSTSPASRRPRRRSATT